MSENTAKFWDKMARSYAARPVSNPENYAQTLSDTRKYLRPEDKVMELGAGTASTALTLSDAVADYLVTDLSSEMIAIGREKANAAGADNLRFLIHGAERFEDIDEEFDVVLAFNLYHLIRDADSAIAAVSDRVKTGGYLISKSACVTGWARPMMVLIVLMRAVGKAPYVGAYSPKRYDAFLEAAGFEIVERRFYSGLVKTYFTVARKIK